MSDSVLVLGGGIAGIAAAVRLAQAGAPVTLIETSGRLGGRATSHQDPTTGEMVDNCQHVLMGCCTNLLDLYTRLGVVDSIRWHPKLHFFDKRGHHDVLAGGVLPAPMHMGPALWRFRCLSFGEKLAISRAMLAMMRIGPEARAKLHAEDFASWLLRHGQPEGAMKKYWEVVVVSALNQRMEKTSAAYALQVFQEGFLVNRGAYVMGTSDVPLGRLYDAARETIQKAGGSVRLGASVQEIQGEAGRVSGVMLSNGEKLEADTYVIALPFDRLDKVLSDEVRVGDDRFNGLGEFEHSPILGIHLWFHKKVTDLEHLVLVDSPLQWVFNKGVDAEGRQYFHAVVSAAHEWVGVSADEILEMAVRELADYVPMAGEEGAFARGRVIKERRATFSPSVGIETHRPTARGATENLMLGGDWTASGWPATMEGAARSGYEAAGAALGQEAGAFWVEPLDVSWCYRAVAMTGSR